MRFDCATMYFMSCMPLSSQVPSIRRSLCLRGRPRSRAHMSAYRPITPMALLSPEPRPTT